MLMESQSRYNPHDFPGDIYLQRIRAVMGIEGATGDRLLQRLPFAGDDPTAGAENELQSVVAGPADRVDLPRMIRESTYHRQMVRRIAAGEMPGWSVNALDNFIDRQSNNIWENSWVRFPYPRLNAHAREILKKDLKQDKSDPESPARADAGRFFVRDGGETMLRVPVSYLLKLSLADAIGSATPSHSLIHSMANRLMGHFLNDNTSPEIHSFFTVQRSAERTLGQSLARETAMRFLFTQLLVQYANRRFGLLDNGQRVMIYSAPNPPVRQNQLNDIIPDSFYRELFMSPCLSGWDRGETKHRYMELCHQVLSRSQMNAVRKLKDAGIIVNNLVVMPNPSNTSLANNGVHVSLGSQGLGRLMADPHSAFSNRDEKYIGDLAIKIVEHFLPLFVGTFTAAPYRLDFQDFHPEKVLGFLSHELDFTHLRMLWRRWKKKAKLKFMGRAITPFGPQWIDRAVSRALSIRGDMVPDFRLLDYLVALLSTEESPSLDGSMENDARLLKDLAHQGVFHESMSVYQLYKLRSFNRIGFSGFEGRYYSLFPSLEHDMAPAVDLQNLVTALAFKYILNGRFTHEDIPDHPETESERRQIFFAAAIGLPTVFIHHRTRNRFLQGIVGRVLRSRSSRRYPGYIRIHVQEYNRALMEMIQQDGDDLIRFNGLESVFREFRKRIEDPESRASARLIHSVLEKTGEPDPLRLAGETFNTASEEYYRNDLRRQHMSEGIRALTGSLGDVLRMPEAGGILGQAFPELVQRGEDPVSYLANREKAILDETLEEGELRQAILLAVLAIHREIHGAICGDEA